MVSIDRARGLTRLPDSHTPSVDVHVWDDEDAHLLEDLVSGGGDGTIRRLRDDLSLDL